MYLLSVFNIHIRLRMSVPESSHSIRLETISLAFCKNYIMLLQDNNRPHTAAQTKLAEMHCTTVKHPP